MKNKGFTLIELLAVILILSLLAVLATTSITKVVDDSKTKLYDAQINSIKASAEAWGSNHLGALPNNGECVYITLKTLKNTGLIDDEVRDPRTNRKLNDDLKIKITSINTQTGNNKFIYEVDTNVDGCSKALFDNGEVVYFDVSNGEKCTNYHNDNSKDGYNGLSSTKTTNNQNSCLKFNAFLDRGGNNINLFLDHNTSLSNSNTVDSNALGPVTAIDKLKEDTEDWNGVETPDNYTYYSKAGVHKNKIDESITASYDTIDYTIDYSNSKARLITANEVAKIAGVENFNETSNDSTVVDEYGVLHMDGTYIVNLDTASFATTEPTNQWILATDDWYITSSAIHDTYGSFWSVTSSVTLTFGTNLDNGQLADFGIRPVIEVKRNKIS